MPGCYNVLRQHVSDYTPCRYNVLHQHVSGEHTLSPQGCYTNTLVTRTPAVTKALRQHLSDMHTYLYNDSTPECE